MGRCAIFPLDAMTKCGQVTVRGHEFGGEGAKTMGTAADPEMHGERVREIPARKKGS